ncbi:RDD family protein [Oryzobacter telluris]|uniref:RDD family protein n=1 Tax=Oryzobacter telluris TaxID=3149179 RepID=UPI00370D6E56
MTDTPSGPGWYEDPDDPLQLRYFDGVVWSTHTTPRRSPSAEQSTIGRATPQVARPGAGGLAGTSSGGAPGGQRDGSRGPSGGWPGAGGNAYGNWQAARTDVLPDGAVLAEWWRRLLARLLDSLISSLLGLVIAIPWLGEAMRVLEKYLSAAAAAGTGTPPDFAPFLTEFTTALLPVTMVSLVVSLVYEVGFLAWKSATPGKMVLGTVVRRVGDGEPIGLVTALRRQVVGLVASAMAFIPLLGVAATVLNVLDPAWLLWDGKRQTLHDKVADTVVVLKG